MSEAVRTRTAAATIGVAAAFGAAGTAQAATVTCGQVITTSTVVGHDLSGCPGDGLRIGADNIVLDFDDHTISGSGPGADGTAGVALDGHRGVTVRNGFVRSFDVGVSIDGDSNVVRRVRVRGSSVGMYILGGDGNRISGGAAIGNDVGILEDEGNDNTITSVTAMSNDFHGIALQGDGTGSTGGNTVLRSRIVDNGAGAGLGVFYERNATILFNTLSGNDTTGFFGQSLDSTSRIASNTSSGGIRGFWIRQSGSLFGSTAGPLIHGNSAQQAAIGFHIDGSAPVGTKEDRLVGNRAQFNEQAGFLIDAGTNTLLRDNVAGSVSGRSGQGGGNGIGIDVREGEGIRLWDNRTHSNRGDGILVGEFNISGTDLRGNAANFNGDDGIEERGGDATLTSNVAIHNADVGILAQPDDADGGGNRAGSNGTAQCVNVQC